MANTCNTYFQASIGFFFSKYYDVDKDVLETGLSWFAELPNKPVLAFMDGAHFEHLEFEKAKQRLRTNFLDSVTKVERAYVENKVHDTVKYIEKTKKIRCTLGGGKDV